MMPHHGTFGISDRDACGRSVQRSIAEPRSGSRLCRRWSILGTRPTIPEEDVIDPGEDGPENATFRATHHIVTDGG